MLNHGYIIQRTYMMKSCINIVTIIAMFLIASCLSVDPRDKTTTLTETEQWRHFTETFIGVATSICLTVENTNDAEGIDWRRKLRSELSYQLAYQPMPNSADAMEWYRILSTAWNVSENVNCSSVNSFYDAQDVFTKLQKEMQRLIHPLPPPLTWYDMEVCVVIWFSPDLTTRLDPGELHSGAIGIVAGVARPQGWVEIWDGRQNSPNSPRHLMLQYNGRAYSEDHVRVFRLPGHAIATHMGRVKEDRITPELRSLPRCPPDLLKMCPKSCIS